MSHDSPHWNWGAGFCKLHPGAGVPCRACIDGGHPDLFDPDAKAGLKNPDAVNFVIRGAVSGRMSSAFINKLEKTASVFHCPKCSKEQFMFRCVDGDFFCQTCNTAIERRFQEVQKAVDSLPTANPCVEHLLPNTREDWKVSDNPAFTAQFRSEKGGMMTVPVDTRDLHAGMIVQIAQERRYTYEQYQTNFKDLRVAAKNRNFGLLYRSDFVESLQAQFEIRDETSVFKRKTIDMQTRQYQKLTEAEIAVENILFREPPQLSSNEAEFYDQVRVNGIIQPIWVQQLNESDFELLNGARRLNAAKVLKLKTVPCIVLKQGDGWRLSDDRRWRDQAKSASFAPPPNPFTETKDLMGPVLTFDELATNPGKSLAWIRGSFREPPK